MQETLRTDEDESEKWFERGNRFNSLQLASVGSVEFDWAEKQSWVYTPTHIINFPNRKLLPCKASPTGVQFLAKILNASTCLSADTQPGGFLRDFPRAREHCNECVTRLTA